MDTYGFLLIVVGGILYLLTFKKSQGWAKFAILLVGIGIGIIIGALGAYIKVTNMF